MRITVDMLKMFAAGEYRLPPEVMESFGIGYKDYDILTMRYVFYGIDEDALFTPMPAYMEVV